MITVVWFLPCVFCGYCFFFFLYEIPQIIQTFLEENDCNSHLQCANFFVWCYVAWVLRSDFKEYDMPHKAKTTCERARENICSVIGSIMPRGHFEHVSVILASLPWDVAAIYLIQSCEADRLDRGSVQGKDERGSGAETPVLRGMLAGDAVCARCCVHGFHLPRPSTWVMKAQRRSELSCLNHKSVSTAFQRKKYRSRALAFCSILGIRDCPQTWLVIKNAGQIVSRICHL